MAERKDEWCDPRIFLNVAKPLVIIGRHGIVFAKLDKNAFCGVIGTDFVQLRTCYVKYRRKLWT